MFLVAYEAEEGNHYAGGTVKRWTIVDDLEEAAGFNPVAIHSITINSTLSGTQIRELIASVKAKKTEEFRQRQIREAEDRLAQLQATH